MRGLLAGRWLSFLLEIVSHKETHEAQRRFADNVEPPRW
jgi:hypothetical protein